MAESFVIAGGRVIDPGSGVDGVADLVIADGHISGLDAPVPAGARVIDARGLVVSPGFVDLHTHLRYPGFPEKETIATGTAAAAAGGFTTVCAMANTRPVVDAVAVFEQILAAVAREARVHVHQLAAVSRDLAGHELVDMAALAAAGAIAFSDDGKPVWNARLMRGALAAAAALGRPISVHEEDPDVVRGGVANAGEPARAHGLPEWPCEGEASLVVRDVRLLMETGGHLHVAHVSCAETIPVIREAQSLGLQVTAEVTPHHLRLADTLLLGDQARGLGPAHPCTKVNPPLRSEADIDAMVNALADGTIGAIATDHAPHAAGDKATTYTEAAFGISSIETALPLCLDLVRAGRISLSTLIARLTSGPAAIFDLPAGTLAPGARADVCVFDPDRPWRVGPATLVSKGKNTPLEGAELRGRVMLTLAGGMTVHEESREA